MVGDVGVRFLMGLEEFFSGESHLRFRRESEGKFLILRLYSVGVGGCERTSDLKVEGRVIVWGL